MPRYRIKAILYGTLASGLLLVAYASVLSLVSGWSFALAQFSSFWYFIVSLALGFGIQVGLFTHLKNLVKGGHGAGAVVGVTGTASTAAMVSCCTHYLVNLLPILGVTGVVTFAAQYQTQLFWVGILFNLGGIAYIANRIITFNRV